MDNILGIYITLLEEKVEGMNKKKNTKKNEMYRMEESVRSETKNTRI